MKEKILEFAESEGCGYIECGHHSYAGTHMLKKTPEQIQTGYIKYSAKSK